MNRYWTALVVGLAALVSTVAVQAQEDSKGPHWHVVGGNDETFMTADVHGAKQLKDGTVLLNSAMYFASSQDLNGGTIDFALSSEQIDCAKPYRYRTVFAEGFAAGVGPAVFQGETLDTPWKTAPADTLAGTRWELVCKGIPEGTALYGVKTHEQVLQRFRDLLRNGTSGGDSDLPAEAEQILRDVTI